MKTKGKGKTKVNIVTLGCSKNQVDSEELLTQLRGNGIDAVHESTVDDSNVVVINTDRKSVVEGKSVSVRVDLGGRRIIKKTKKKNKQKHAEGRRAINRLTIGTERINT